MSILLASFCFANTKFFHYFTAFQLIVSSHPPWTEIEFSKQCPVPDGPHCKT